MNTIKVDCSKCNGSGQYQGFGVCFRCGGSGVKINVGRGKQKFSAGDMIKCNSRKKVFEIIEVTKKYYLTACETRLGRHIDRYPEGSDAAYQIVNSAN